MGRGASCSGQGICHTREFRKCSRCPPEARLDSGASGIRGRPAAEVKRKSCGNASIDGYFHMLEKLFEGIGKHPMGAKALFWLIVFVMVGWLALVLVRFWLRVRGLKN